MLAIADQRHKDEVRKAKSKKDAVVDVVKSKIKILIKKWIYPVDVYIKILKSGGMALKVGGLTLERPKEKSDKYAKEQEETARRNRENIKKWFGNAWDGVKVKLAKPLVKWAEMLIILAAK